MNNPPEYPSDPATPAGTYLQRHMDLARWDPEAREWQLQNISINTLDEGRDRLAQRRDALEGSNSGVRYALVHVRNGLTITDMGE